MTPAPVCIEVASACGESGIGGREALARLLSGLAVDAVAGARYPGADIVAAGLRLQVEASAGWRSILDLPPGSARCDDAASPGSLGRAVDAVRDALEILASRAAAALALESGRWGGLRHVAAQVMVRPLPFAEARGHARDEGDPATRAEVPASLRQTLYLDSARPQNEVVIASQDADLPAADLGARRAVDIASGMVLVEEDVVSVGTETTVLDTLEVEDLDSPGVATQDCIGEEGLAQVPTGAGGGVAAVVNFTKRSSELSLAPSPTQHPSPKRRRTLEAHVRCT